MNDQQSEIIYPEQERAGFENPVITGASIKDVKAIADLKKTVYPSGMAQGEEYINQIIGEAEESGYNSCFVAKQHDTAVGYLLSLIEESEIHPDEDVVCIYDMAILPQHRNLWTAKRLMAEAVALASVNNMAIEAQARAGTSFLLLLNKRIKDRLNNCGYAVAGEPVRLEDYLAEEDFYFIRLEKIPKIGSASGKEE